VLTALAKASQPLTASAIAQRVGMPRSSTYQLLEVLTEDGFVTHYPEEARWGLGVAAFELGSAYLRQDPLQRLAQPIIQQLARKLEFGPDALKSAVVIQFGILDGIDSVYLLKETTHPANSSHISVLSDVGVRLPAHLTASGRAILAGQSAAQLKATLASFAQKDGRLSRRTNLGPATLTDLRSLLASEAKLGYSVEHGFVTEGFSTVAVAARNHHGIATASFGITFRSSEVSEAQIARLAELLGQTADRLSRRLGPQ
jgi:DNA-binding IclR family transcriptional regulator